MQWRYSQGWGEYYSGTRLAQNDKHEYTKNIVLEYYSSTDFPVLILVCSVLAPALDTVVLHWGINMVLLGRIYTYTVQASVSEPDRVVFTLHPRLRSEFILGHGNFGPNLVVTTWIGGFEYGRCTTLDVLRRPRSRKSLHVATGSDTNVQDKNLGHGLRSV